MASIDYFKTHPLRIAKNQRDTPLAMMRSAENDHTAGTQSLHPSASAYIHYGGVELADKLSILKPSIDAETMNGLADSWNQSCGFICRQLLFYVWRVITKELRHGNSKMTAKAFGANFQENPYAALIHKITSGGKYQGHIDGDGGLHLGPFVDAIERHYRKGGWHGFFGGKKWADIALQLQMYVDGKASAMIAADRCWTLVHNTGPIFNKGFYFSYHDQHLAQVLEHQAHGSVFDMDILWEYDHPTVGFFLIFKELAVKAIQSVEPDYLPGQKSDAPETVNKPQVDKPVLKKVGSVIFTSQKERNFV